MKTSIIARIFVGIIMISCIVYCIIVGSDVLINSGFTKDSIVDNIIGIIGVSIIIATTLVLFAVIIVTFAKFMINVIIWTFTGYWQKNWLFD